MLLKSYEHFHKLTYTNRTNTRQSLVTVLHTSGQIMLKCTLRERLRTHKVFTIDQCFYLNYHKFSIKSFVLDVIRIASDFPHFYYMLGGNLGSLLYGDVSVMYK